MEAVFWQNSLWVEEISKLFAAHLRMGGIFYLPKCANRLEWYLYDRYHLLGTFCGRTKIHNFVEADFPKNREVCLFA